MRILAISDTHNKHLQIPSRFIENSDNSVDTIVHAGDVSSRGNKGEIIDFLKWYNELNFKNKILIAGNHDFYFEEGFVVFTEKYHLKRGSCCKSGCRHCPYGFRTKDAK